MNLYKLHSKPESMEHYEFHYDNVVELIWSKYENNPVELKKREKAIAKDPRYAYWYAYAILRDRFPLGEEAIAKNSECAYLYARNVLYNRFPLGEETIAKSMYYTRLYAKNIIKGPWTINGKTHE